MSDEPTTPEALPTASSPNVARDRATNGSNGLDLSNLGNLPTGYDQMFLIARDPHWLFTYWDFDYSSLPSQRQLAIEVYRDETLEKTIDINEVARNWYIPVQAADSAYRVALGWRDAAGQFHTLAKAGPAQTPPESVSQNWDTAFATVPFHLSFNFLVQVIEAAQSRGIPIGEALAKLQEEAAQSGNSVAWGETQLRMLEALLGKGFLERLSSPGSADWKSLFRAEDFSRLDSESISELLAKGRLAQVIAPPELTTSGMLASWLQHELSSGPISSESAVSSEIGPSSAGLSSAGLSSAGLSSAEVGWSSGGLGLSSETLASWESAVSSFGSAEMSTGSESLLSEVSSLGVSSFELSSFALSSAEFGSWLEQRLLELSSFELSSAVGASWSGLEFGPSSWNELAAESSLFSAFGASWGEQPFSWFEREFFMHVNAEVIFYGGTHPAAKVTVAGQPIQLRPDGTFTYHFKFPDNDFEIPIVAVSPDGQETRSAILFFKRDTAREGDVGATKQPEHLTEPMGRRS